MWRWWREPELRRGLVSMGVPPPVPVDVDAPFVDVPDAADEGGGPRNVWIRRGDGSEVVRPFRGLRRVPPSAPAGLARTAEQGRSGVRGAGGGSGAAEGRTAAHGDGEVES